LDLFTTFGTQLFAPFSNHRFALSAIPIIDLVYSVPLLISLGVGAIWPRKSFVVGSMTLFFTSAYLLFGIMQHDKAIAVARSFCAENDLKCHRIEAFPLLPTLFAQRLWVQTREKVYFTEYSGWTKKSKPWVSHTTNPIPAPIKEHSLFKTYEWFTYGIYVTKADTNYGFCVIDSRFGLLAHQPLGRFSVCFKDDQVVKNKNYDAIEVESTPPSFGTTLKYYWRLISDLWTWTFGLNEF
jgi:inner membrane protein